MRYETCFVGCVGYIVVDDVDDELGRFESVHA